MTLGSRTKQPLTAMLVKSASIPGKYHDGKGTGLYLRVEKNGSRFWIQRITIKGKRRELGLGSPPLVSLVEARERAGENKRVAMSGGDPLQAKQDLQNIPTFAEAAQTVLEIHRPTWRNAKHAAQFLSTLKTYTFPTIGRLKISEVTTADVLSTLQPIWLEKPETARRVKQRIGTVMKWAIAQGWRQDDPAQNVGQALPKHDRVKKHRKALHYAEVAGCINTVQNSGAWLGSKLAFEFLVLTASRSGEVRGALWDEIHFEEGATATTATTATWIIPASRMKMKKPHRVPLAPRAIEILQEAQQLQGNSGLLFPSQTSKLMSDMTLSKLVKSLGFDADVHGFRTSFRTWAQEQTNFSREVAEAALAHKVGDAAEQSYARSDVLDKRRKLMEHWETYLTLTRSEVLVKLKR